MCEIVATVAGFQRSVGFHIFYRRWERGIRKLKEKRHLEIGKYRRCSEIIVDRFDIGTLRSSQHFLNLLCRTRDSIKKN